MSADALPQFSLNHVAIPVQDVQRTATFYELLGGVRGFLRSDLDGRPELLQMAFDDRFVELIAAPAGTPVSGHLAFRTPDIHVAWRMLDLNGHAPKAAPRQGRSGVMWFFVDDPSGNAVEITSPIGPCR